MEVLSAEEIREKVFRKAEDFRQHFYEKKWAQAKHDYDMASSMAVFMELGEDDMAVLFGSRPYLEDDREEPADGLFREAEVEKEYWECIKRNQTYEVKPYPGNPNKVKDYNMDVWSRQQAAAMPHSPYDLFSGTA